MSIKPIVSERQSAFDGYKPTGEFETRLIAELSEQRHLLLGIRKACEHLTERINEVERALMRRIDDVRDEQKALGEAAAGARSFAEDAGRAAESAAEQRDSALRALSRALGTDPDLHRLDTEPGSEPPPQ